MNHTVYTLIHHAESGANWVIDQYTSEGAAEAAAEDLGIQDYEIAQMPVPLPEILVVVERGLVSSVTTVDGLELDAVVRDYSPDGDGEFDEYTV